MEKSSQIAWKIVSLRHLFTLKVVPLIEVLLYERPLDPSVIACRPPLDRSAGVCLVKRKVESSMPTGSNFSPYLLAGRNVKGTWGYPRRQKKKGNDIHENRVASDDSEWVPTIDVK
jgi:hypothetical protein